jgi:hypothetical protein
VAQSLCSVRSQRAQAETRDRLDAIFCRVECRFQKLLIEETQEMFFTLVMSGGGYLLPSQMTAVRNFIHGFRNDREVAFSLAIKIRRRQLACMLPDYLPPKTLKRWASE